MTTQHTTTPQRTDTSLTLERTLDAPPARVYAALTDAKLAARWLAPGPMKATLPVYDARPGGTLRVEMTGPTPEGGEGRHVAEGRFIELVQDQRVSYTWQWVEADEGATDGDDTEFPETLVTISLEAVGDGRTRLRLVHEKLPDREAVDMHVEGWEGCLAKLPEAL